MHICPERALCSSPDELAPEDDLRSFFVGGNLQGSSLLSLLRGYTATQSIAISGGTGNRSEQPYHAVDTHMPQPRHIVSPFGPSIWTSTTANRVQRPDYPPQLGTPNSATTIFTAGGQLQTTLLEDAPPRLVSARDRLVWIQKRAEWSRAAALMKLGSAEESRPETAELPKPLSTTHPDNHVPHALLTELGPINHSAYPSHLPSRAVDTPEIRSAARSIKPKYSSGPFHTEGEGYLHQFQDEICNMGWKDLAVIRLSPPLSPNPAISLEDSSRRPDRKCGGDIFSTSNPLLTGSHFTRYFATVPESYACPPFNAVVDKQDLDPSVIPMRRLVDRLDPRSSTSSSPANSSDPEVTAITRSSEYELWKDSLISTWKTPRREPTLSNILSIRPPAPDSAFLSPW